MNYTSAVLMTLYQQNVKNHKKASSIIPLDLIYFYTHTSLYAKPYSQVAMYIHLSLHFSQEMNINR